LLAGELVTGGLKGLTLAALALPAVALLFGNVQVALCVALSIAAAGTVATTIGLVLPYALHRLGSDPALGSGPLATIVQDVLSIVIYFALAAWIID
jgi:magnesium transporter